MALRDWLHSLTGTSSTSHGESLSAHERPRHQENPWRPLKSGGTVSADFSHHQETVRATCRIEKLQASSLGLRIVAELGKASLRGLKNGTHGYLELDNCILPFRVTYVNLPCVEVRMFPHHARPAHRQLLRVPATFLVRLRRKGSHGLWIAGQGVDLSAGGCHFSLTPPTLPKAGDAYDVEMLIMLPDGSEDRPLLATEVRWVRPTSRLIYVGMEAHAAQRTALTTAASQFQHSLSRRPQDYVLTRS